PKPGKAPAQANYRCKVIPIVVVNLRIWIRRVLADQLNLSQRTGQMSRRVEIIPTCARESKQSRRPIHEGAGSSLRFPWHAKIFVAHSEIQSEIRLHLKVILEKQTEFALAPRALFAKPRNVCRIWRSRRIKSLRDGIERAAEIDEQRLCGGCVGSQSLDCSRIDARYGNSPGSEIRARHHIERVK